MESKEKFAIVSLFDRLGFLILYYLSITLFEKNIQD